MPHFNRISRLAAPLALMVITGACGQTDAPITNARVAGPVSGGSGTGHGPQVNWDKPYPDGKTPASDDWKDAAALKLAGSLKFTPIIPSIGIEPTTVQVTDTDLPLENRGVAFVYKFPTGSDFPTDGRVNITEQPGLGPDEISSLTAANNREFPGGATMITFTNGAAAEIKSW